MKATLLLSLLVVLCAHRSLVEARSARWKQLRDLPDYDASGDYFEMNVDDHELKKVGGPTESSSSTASSNEDVDDEGVTCSATNITEILANYYLENHVLVLFRVNVTANEEELFQ